MVTLPASGVSIASWRNRLWREWFDSPYLKTWRRRDPDPRLFCEVRGHQLDEWLQTAWRLLNHNPHPDLRELTRVLSDISGRPTYSGAVTTLVRRYRDRYPDLGSAGLRLREAPFEVAAAGTPRSDPFRSTYERRAAAAMTRLGIRWSYESERLPWRDHRNMLHQYTPDFVLLDFRDTYVEIKGPAGADAVDTLKMQRVLAWNPTVTLLLWDADTVDYIEDAPHASALLGLLRTTKAA